jgi:hypothetical protein
MRSPGIPAVSSVYQDDDLKSLRMWPVTHHMRGKKGAAMGLCKTFRVRPSLEHFFRGPDRVGYVMNGALAFLATEKRCESRSSHYMAYTFSFCFVPPPWTVVCEQRRQIACHEYSNACIPCQRMFWVQRPLETHTPGRRTNVSSGRISVARISVLRRGHADMWYRKTCFTIPIRAIYCHGDSRHDDHPVTRRS